MSSEEQANYSKDKQEYYGRNRGKRWEKKGYPHGYRHEGFEKREGMEIKVFGRETSELLKGLLGPLKEIQETGKILRGMVAGLPSQEQKKYEERIKNLEEGLAKQGQELVKTNEGREALLKENEELRKASEEFKKQIEELEKTVAKPREKKVKEKEKIIERKPREIKGLPKEEIKEAKKLWKNLTVWKPSKNLLIII